MTGPAPVGGRSDEAIRANRNRYPDMTAQSCGDGECPWREVQPAADVDALLARATAAEVRAAELAEKIEAVEATRDECQLLARQSNAAGRAYASTAARLTDDLSTRAAMSSPATRTGETG